MQYILNYIDIYSNFDFSIQYISMSKNKTIIDNIQICPHISLSFPYPLFRYKLWPTELRSNNVEPCKFYVGPKYLNWPKTPPSCFLVSDRTNGQFWQCSTNLHNPCSSSQLLDLCDDSSIVYGQVGCIDSVYGVF